MADGGVEFGAGFGGGAVDEEDAFGVVEFVLDGAGEEAVGFELDRGAVEDLGFDADGERAGDIGGDFGEAQAAFALGDGFSEGFDFGVEEDHGHVRLEIGGLAVEAHGAGAFRHLGDIEDEHLEREADLLGGEHPHLVNYNNIPSCTYCHPEVASIGLTEQACKDQKLDYTVGKFPFSANGRARTSGETDGFVKIIRDAKYGEILGAHIVGAHATELIHELVVARENEFTVEEIDLAIHAHPTLSEAIGEAVLDSMGKMLHA